jgi:murein L,D-transpeptidase YafK
MGPANGTTPAPGMPGTRGVSLAFASPKHRFGYGNNVMTHTARTCFYACALALATAASLPFALSGQSVPLGTALPGQPMGQLLEEDRRDGSFLAHQLSFPRVSDARDATDARLRRLFDEKGVSYPAREIFIRVFKHERLLELWARADTESEFDLIVRYPVCALPGHLGPKQRMGDVQVPEGFYYIDEFNPRSAFHLSLRVNYPNLADRMRRQVPRLGGDIYIHGGCETVGCVPIEDHNIAELYWAAAQASDAGQAVIPVHIFPARLDPDRLQWLEQTFAPERDLLRFWKNLAEGYSYFEEHRRVPWITVGEDGRYVVPDPPSLGTEPELADEPLPAPPAPDTAAAPEEGAEPTGGPR